MTKRRGVSHLCFELGSLRRRFGFLCRHRRVRRRFGGELLPETIDPLGAPRNFRGNLRFLRLQRGAKTASSLDACLTAASASARAAASLRLAATAAASAAP